MSRMIKVFILVVIVLASFSFANSAKASYIYATSTPCGVRLTWKPTFPKTTCLATDSFWQWGSWIDYCVTQSVNKSKIYVYRSTGGTSFNNYNNQLIFSGDVSSVPTSYDTHYDYYTPEYYEYNYGQYSSYTDLTAVQGTNYYYKIYEYEPSASEYSYTSIAFQRPDLKYYVPNYGYNVTPPVWTDPNYPMWTQTDMSYGDYLVQVGNEFSNSCPFVQIPGDDLMGWSSFRLVEPSGGKISDLTCSENKYAFKNSTTGWFEENLGSSDDKFDIIKMYGFSSDKFEDVSNEIQSMYYNWGYNYAYEGYKIYKTGSTSFNFYREVCTQGKDWLYGDRTCTFSKVPTTDYTLTQPTAGYNLVEFNNNYTPPPETSDYFTEVAYRVTAVNQYGAESWPVEFSWTEPLSTCSNECINPNTIDPNEIFTIKNVLLSNDFLGISKVLGWNNADNELGQYTYNASSTNQEWYIKPSNESKYAILVSKQDGKALSTNGYIDWSWTHFGESLYSLFSVMDEGPSFPGYIKGYENIYTYKGEYPDPNWYDEQYGLSAIGYKIKKKDYNSSDDSQKWCIAPETSAVWNEEGTDYVMVKTGNYAFINKNVQASMRLLNLDYSDPLRNIEGFLVWLNPFESGGYYKNDQIQPYYPGYYGNADLWQIDIPITELSCTGPNNETIQSGQNLTYYEATTTLQYYDPLDPSGADYCSDYAISASCNNGVLGVFKYSDGTDYTDNTSSLYPQCNNACLHGGIAIPHGSSHDFYITNTSTACENSSNKGTVSCTNGVTSGTTNAIYDICTQTTVTTAPIPVNLNEARLVPNIVNITNQCRGKVDTNEISTYGLNPSTTTCDIYQIKAGNTVDTVKYSSGDPKSTTLTDWPLVDHGKDYKIICKDNAFPNYTTAISKTLKCVLNPEVKEI